MKFNGYKRSDGKVGIRNHVLIVPTCACSADVARMIAEKTPGSVCARNQNGCGQVPKDMQITLDLLAGFAANPNVYATLAVGLGCEQMQWPKFKAKVESLTNKPVLYVSIQAEGGVGRTLKKGMEMAKSLVDEAAKCVREECDLSEIILGTNCGGSDPTSGLAANRVVGDVADRLADMGAVTIISETPEFMGAEEVLAEQAVNKEVGQQIIDIVKNFEAQLALVGENPRDGNPSPGNKASGITTLEEKSLGCIHKAGTRPIQAVFRSGDVITVHGPNAVHGTVVMDTVAYDVASVADMTASGAQLTLFTTGMGTPTGNPIAPVVKMTANAKTFEFDNDFMDFDTSGIITGEKTVEELGKAMLDFLVEVCNGKKVKAEEWGMEEIAINHICTYD
jgi:altronate dehydratase large subunit